VVLDLPMKGRTERGGLAAIILSEIRRWKVGASSFLRVQSLPSSAAKGVRCGEKVVAVIRVQPCNPWLKPPLP
jgi:hypothetical protein